MQSESFKLWFVAIVSHGISCHYQEESVCIISGAVLQVVAGGC